MVQTVSFPFELLFIAGVLLTLVLLIAAAVSLVKRRFAAGRRLLIALATGWAVYLSIVFAVAAVTPGKIVPRNQDLCSDEMCFTVVDVKTAEQLGTVRANGLFYVVTVRVSNHGRGRAQSERGLRALLWSDGHRFEVSEQGQRAWQAVHPSSLPLTSRVQPGESVLSDQVFEIEPQVADPGLVLSNGFTPGYFVLGECPLFHRPTMLRLSTP
jgi:hypothetical protein